MAMFWKKIPPGWRLYDDEEPRYEHDIGDGGDGGGDNGGDGGGDSGGGGGDSGGDAGGFDSGGSNSLDSGNGGGGDFGGGNSGGDNSGFDSSNNSFESDGDAGDNNAPMRAFEQHQQQQDADRERQRIQDEIDRAEAERKRAEEERKRQEAAAAEAERQRQIDAEFARQQAQQGPGEQPLPSAVPPLPLPEPIFRPQPPVDLPQRSDTPSNPDVPRIAAHAAAQAAANTGATPEQIAQTAEAAARMASDRQTLDQQSAWTRAAFRSTYGEQAGPEWVRQHEAELARNQQLYGSQEPTAGARPLQGAPTGTPVAPDRRIGVVPPPGQGVAPQPGAAPAATAPALDWAHQMPGDLDPATARPLPSATQPTWITPDGNTWVKGPDGGARATGVLAPPGAYEAVGRAAAPAPAAPPAPPASSTPVPGLWTALPGQGPSRPATAPTSLSPAPYKPVSSAAGGLSPADSREMYPTQPRAATPYKPVSPAGGGLPPEDVTEMYPAQPALEPAPEPSRAQPPVDTRPQDAGDPNDVFVLDDGAGGENRVTRQQWQQGDAELHDAFPIVRIEPVNPIGRMSGDEVIPGSFRPAPAERIALDAQGRAIEPSLSDQQYGTERYAATDTSIQPPPVAADTLVTTRRPLDTLAMLALQSRGGPVSSGQIQDDAYNIAQGIAAMIQGKPDVRWPEPYLNDVARMAWGRQEAQQGRASDPRDAPVDYIERWKDAFYGRDENVPLVKELNQQMIDYAADTSRPGGPFNWKEVYGANGDKGLILPQATGVDCGPDAFSTIMRSRGYNVAPKDMFSYVRTFGNRYHNGDEFQGPAQMVDLVNRQAGLQAEQVGLTDREGKGWAAVDAELAAGRPVMLSGPTHWWAVTAKSPDGKYYAGATGLGVTRDGWMQRDQFVYSKSGPTDAVLVRGDANPDAPIVKQLGLKPPSNAVRNTRQFLSPTMNDYQTPAERGAARIEQGFQQQSLNDSGGASAGERVAPPDAATKPTYTGDEAVRMRQTIMQSMPEIQFDPNDSVEDRMAKMAPALQWLKNNYGIDDAALAGMAYNENHLGMANSGAVRGNNLWSVQYNPQDPLSTGPIPEGRWAQYPSIKAALARFVAMYAHPDNGYRHTWQNRNSTEGFLNGLRDDHYIVDEPGPGNSVGEWRQGVQRGVDLYNRVKSGSVTTRENPAIGRGV